MANTNPVHVIICSICEKRINVETSKTDEDGQPIHEDCYVDRLTGKTSLRRHWTETT